VPAGYQFMSFEAFSLVVCNNVLPENIMLYWGVSICASCPQASQLSFLSIKGFPGVNF
jgi:hypothetical protein